MESKVVSVKGEAVRSIELADAVFALPVNEDVIWYAINNELANSRLGTASTKTRGQVHGTNRRPYSQKGTGRARQGDFKSPIFVGGGIVFGPHPRDYSYSMPKKAKRLAMKSILSLKAQNGTMQVVEDFTVESGKTRDLIEKIGLLAGGVIGGTPQRTVLVLKDDDVMVRRAGRNLPWLSFLKYDRLRAHDLFYGRKVLVLESAAKALGDFYAER
jgi:large subunit ribosomal protein L4